MIRIDGLTEIQTVLRGLPTQVSHPVTQQIHAVALKPFVSAAYFAAPLRSGRTARSIGVTKPSLKRAGSIGLVIAGPRRGIYGGQVAHLSEFGTIKRDKTGPNRGVMPRKPFIEPAWNRTKGQVLGSIQTATGTVVRNYMKRTVKRITKKYA